MALFFVPDDGGMLHVHPLMVKLMLVHAFFIAESSCIFF